MGKSPVVEAEEFKAMCERALIRPSTGKRDVALLCVAYSTGLMPNEIAKLRVQDYLGPDGFVRVDSEVTSDIAYNRKRRPLFWSNARAVEALDVYLDQRRQYSFGTRPRSRRYRGLEPMNPLFLTARGTPFRFTDRLTTRGAISSSCEALTEIFRLLHTLAGIDHGNASAARRTFAVRLHRGGANLKEISVLLGVESLSAVRDMVSADPRRLGRIVAGIV